jgi:peptidyl-prolyl cis-trans isomerase D
MLTWISENAKWVIYISIAGIAAGLLFMDMSSLQIDKRPPIGVVNGDKLSTDLFEARLRQIQIQQPGLSNEQAVQMRDELFRSFVQQHLKQKIIADVKIAASVHEMKIDLRVDPPSGIDREPTFQTDGVFDFAKYEEWLANEATYNIPYMREYENMLKTMKIPEKQLRVFIGAGVHPSTLEAKYNVLRRETKFELLSALGNVDAFQDVSISQNSIDSLFKAEPDSFFVAEDLAKVRYVAMPIKPSTRDIEGTYEYAKTLLAQIKEGSDFAEIARSSSDDLGSAAQGGELGDYAPRGKWVREFDSTAFALDSGEISEPIRTQFGYHIIQSLGKRVENDEEQVKARHILLSITATSETTDSLEIILNKIKDVMIAGGNVAEITKEYQLDFKYSDWFKKGAEIPELGYVSGLSRYAFFNPLRPKDDSKISDILQNSNWIAIFEKVASLSAGSRSVDFAQPKIEQTLRAKAKVNAIAEHLKTNRDKIAAAEALDSASERSVEKVTIDSALVSFEGYLPGLGYANPELYKALSNAKEGEWSEPYTSTQNAVLIKILKKSVSDEEELKALISDELLTAWQYGVFSVFGDYTRNLESGAKIVNNLDLYHRE